MLLLLVGLVMAEGKSVVPGDLLTDDRIVCSGLRLNPQATHDELAAFEALCNTTARAFGTITAQYLWDAYFVCTSAANNCTSLQEYSQRYPKEFEELEAKATDLQSRYGGMYVGRIDHLESVVCQREAGSHMLGGACKACYLIGLDKLSFQRRMKRKQKATDSAPSKYTNRSVLSSSDKDQLLETQREDRSKLQRTVHRIQSALDRTKEKLGAAVMRLTGLFSQARHDQDAAEVALEAERRVWAARFSRMEASHLAQLNSTRSTLHSKNQSQQWALANARCDEQTLSRAQLVLQQARHDAEIIRINATHQRALQALAEDHVSEMSRMPSYIQDLIRAEKNGNVSEHPHCVDIIRGMASCLSRGSTKGRKLNDTERHLYGILLNSQSPWAEKFVSLNLLGPHLRTIQKDRAKMQRPIALDFVQESVATLEKQLQDYNLSACPGTICEDGTTCNRRLDWEVVIPQFEGQLPANHSAWKHGVRIWGLVGGPVVVHSIEQLRELFDSRKNEVARYVYVYTWVPVAKHAPWFPFLMIATDNKFDGSWVWDKWRWLVGRSVGQSVGRSVGRSVGGWVGWSVGGGLVVLVGRW